MSRGLTFTPQQNAAINTRGSSLLVSAAAGSGKTKVLVERLLAYITDESEPCDIGDFLIITYTRAAAGELRAKILDEIAKRLAIEPDNKHLRRQSALCYDASIGTIHGFCTDILRENAHILDLSPDFRVADENEATLLKHRVLEELLDARYETIDEDQGFALLIDTMGAGRDDRRLTEVVLDAHSKLKSHAEPEMWIQTQLNMLECTDGQDVSETLWGRYLLTETHRQVLYWHFALNRLLEDMRGCPDFEKAYGASVTASLSSLDAFVQALELNWDAARTSATIEFPRAKNIKGYDDLKARRVKCRDALKKIAIVFEYSSAELLEDMIEVHPAAAALLRLLIDFDDAFAEAKKKRGIVDFSDQEHLTARLLTDQETGGATPLSHAISNRFKEIMVDEYQDVNRVQERIFRAVSKNGSNIFMVGDVKQSIYRFRQADPTIFLAKYKTYRDVDDAANAEQEGRRVVLSMNFRSRKGILDGVNFIFKNIMSEEFGEMDYNTDAFLYPGRTDESFSDPAIELDIIDMSSFDVQEDEESPVKAETEANFVAGRIAELIDCGYEIPDGQGGKRPVSCGDFAILMRSIKNKAAVFAEALSQRDIPVSMSGGEGFFEALEVSVTLSLLNIIDNPMQDIPLMAVLRSPLYGFEPDELASIRTADKKGSFFSALVKFAETDDKCRGFLDEMNALRTIAPDMATDRLIFHLYNTTDMLAVMSALRDGEARRENLMKLMALAGRYETNGYKGLYAFMTFIRRMIDNGDEPAEAGELPSGDAVKIISIHKSKGLEFPIVILADTAKRFNMTDTIKPLLMHAQMGVGLKRTDLERRIEYSTLPRMAVAHRLRREMLAEELRVLYVAMTRAREKLIIVSAFADAGRTLLKLAQAADTPPAPQILESLKSQAELILLPALTRPEADCLREIDCPIQVTDDEAWDIRLIGADTIVKAQYQEHQSTPVRLDVTLEAVEALRQKLSFVYPHSLAPQLPSKLTATELKGRFTDVEAAQDAYEPEYLRKTPVLHDRPDFVTKRTRLTASERGTALHLAMQYIDYGSCTNEDGAAKALQRLREKKFLSEKQYASVKPGKISAFFASQLGQRVLSAENMYREFKFSLLVKASEYFDGGGDDDILFQGVIDCCYEENGSLTIIDFKTDRVTPETIAEKTQLYAPQLNAYALAMKRITGLPVKERILYFFDLEEAAEVTG